MIELRQDVPDNVVAMTAKGKVTADDYENVIIPRRCGMTPKLA
jgi:hypothetical protein